MKSHTAKSPPPPMSDYELTRSHLVSAREALNRRIDNGDDQDSIPFLALEHLVQTLERKVQEMRRPVLVHNGVEYAEMAGRA